MNDIRSYKNTIYNRGCSNSLIWVPFLGSKMHIINNFGLNDNSDKSSWHFVASFLLQKYITQLKTDEYKSERFMRRAMPFLSGWGGFCYLNPKCYYWTLILLLGNINVIGFSKSNFLILIRFWNWLYMMIVKEIVSFFRPQGFACICSFYDHVPVGQWLRYLKSGSLKSSLPRIHTLSC